MNEEDKFKPLKPEVMPYQSSPIPEPPISAIDTIAGLLIAGVALMFLSLAAFSISLVIGLAIGPVGFLGLVFTIFASGVWMLHRVAQNEREINKGVMIGIYIGIGMYLLMIGLCILSAVGMRF